MATNIMGNQIKLGSNKMLRRFTVALVTLALAGVAAKYFVFDQQRYLVPTHSVAPGESLDQVSWSVVTANLGALAGSYVGATTKPVGFATETLKPGQLVPRSTLSLSKPGTVARVVVATKTQLGRTVRTGARVAIWAAERLQNNQFDVPKQIVVRAVVARVLKQQAMFSAANQQVELMISPIQTPIVLSAMATDSAIFLVAQQ